MKTGVKLGLVTAAWCLFLWTLPVEAQEQGPPTCNRETATIVVLSPDDRTTPNWPFVEEVYSAESAVFGTDGHDVIVVLYTDGVTDVTTDPGRDSPVGDTICTTRGNANDNIYAGPGDDVVFTYGGMDKVYTGAGNDEVHAGKGVDRIWGYKTEADEVEDLSGGGGQDHFYVGRGDGVVIVHGNRAPKDVPGDGDHVHPCPFDPDVVVDEGLEIKTFGGITAYGVEYFGPETRFVDPQDAFDPCAANAKSL